VALLTKFLGRTASEGAAFAFGLATAPVLAPAVEELKNQAWRTHPSKALDAGEAAEIVAEDVQLRDWGANEASAHGIDGGRFDALLGAVLNAPGMGELLQARRRGLVSDATFRHGLRKAKLETLWDAAIVGLLDVLLSPADLANAVVQGHMPQAAAAAEALLQGYSADRFDVLVENTGLPPGPETLEAWWRRGIISQAEFETGIREGHTKTKYIPFYEAARVPVLAPSTYAGLRLRGWISAQESYAGGALSGYTPEMMDDLFLNSGRPATAHQIHIGYARGAKLAGVANEEAAIHKAVAQSNIRPEYGDLIYAGRDTYPPLFQLSRLVSSQAITADVAAEWAKKGGMADEVVAVLHTFWAGTAPGVAKPDSHVGKAQTQLWTATHRSYIIDKITRAQADAALGHLIPDAGVRNAVLDTWDVEKGVTVKPLTKSQIKKAYTENVITIDDATTRLEEQGLEEADARLYLTS
jgi:hypothetical protein